MRKQSEACGTEIITQTVSRVDLSSRPFKYWLHPMGDDDNEEPETHTADSVIVATGAKARRLDLPGEEKYWGNGVSACAVCDGSLPMFRNKPLIVIGGGDSAVEEAIYLTKKASKVVVLVRKSALRASKANARRLLSNPKVEVMFGTTPVEIVGEAKERGLMTGVVVKNTASGKEETVTASGLFYAVGHEPATALFKGQLDMDEDGYLVTQPGNAHTSVEGVFAAGDVQDKKYRQAITSAGEFSLFSWCLFPSIWARFVVFDSHYSHSFDPSRFRMHCGARVREVPRGPGERGAAEWCGGGRRGEEGQGECGG